MRSPLPKQRDMDVVRSLTREAASERMPELNWDRIERGVLAEVDRTAVAALVERESSGPSTKAGSAWREMIAVAVAAAAMVTLALGGPTGGPRTSSSRPVTAGVPVGELPIVRDHEGRAFEDATALADGDIVEALRVPVIYRAKNLATWTLAPGSRARIVSAGAPAAASAAGSMTIALLGGAIHAEVVHRDLGESFAVEVETTRVAAHGTSFDVTHAGDRVVVFVREGSVAVGPAGHPGSTQGWLVVGPERASFSLDGGRDVRWLAPPSGESSLAFAPLGSAGHEPSFAPLPIPGARKSSPGQAPSPPASLAVPVGTGAGAASEPISIAATPPKTPMGEHPVEGRHTVIASILSGLSACYERQVAAAGVEVSIESSLRLTILPDGVVREGVFDPPLSPTLMSCASEAVGRAQFPGGTTTYRVEVPVRLSPGRGVHGQP